MLRQKIDWEKVPWLMTKVKVSEEYYVNYWRHTPFPEKEGAQAGGARERERREREWGAESEKRIAESMSPKNWSPNTHFLPSFMSSDKLTSHSLWVAGCNKGGGGGEELSTLAWFESRKGLRKAVSEVKSSRREVSVKGEKEPAGNGVLSLWSVSPEVGTGIRLLSFFMREMGSERAASFPQVTGCFHTSVSGCLPWALYRGGWRETQMAWGQDPRYRNLCCIFFFPFLLGYMYFLSNEMNATVENCLHYPDRERCKGTIGLSSNMGRGFATGTLAWGWSSPPSTWGALAGFK